MTSRSRILLVVLVLFSLANAAGTAYAAAMGEAMHAGAHALLLLVAAYAAGRLLPQRAASGY